MECIAIDQVTLHSWSYLLWHLRDNATTWLKTRNSSEKSQKLESYTFLVNHNVLKGNPDFTASFHKIAISNSWRLVCRHKPAGYSIVNNTFSERPDPKDEFVGHTTQPRLLLWQIHFVHLSRLDFQPLLVEYLIKYFLKSCSFSV